MNGAHEGKPERNHCDDHSGHCVRMDRAERDIQTIFTEIDRMKKWVIAGMGGLLLQAVVFVGGLVIVLMQRGHP